MPVRISGRHRFFNYAVLLIEPFVDFYLYGLGLLVMSPVQLADLENAPLGLGQRHLQLLWEMFIRAFHNGNHGLIFGVQQRGWGLWAALRKGRLHQLVHGA